MRKEIRERSLAASASASSGRHGASAIDVQAFLSQEHKTYTSEQSKGSTFPHPTRQQLTVDFSPSPSLSPHMRQRPFQVADGYSGDVEIATSQRDQRLGVMLIRSAFDERHSYNPDSQIPWRILPALPPSRREYPRPNSRDPHSSEETFNG